MKTLQTLILGDWETGKGSSLTDAGVQPFLQAATSLVYLRLESCRGLTDATLVTAFNSCPNLVYVHVSGHDKSSGSIRGDALSYLKDNPTVVPKLRELRLIDQYSGLLDKPIKAVTRVRRRLRIVTGNTNKWRDEPYTNYMRGDMIF